MRLTCVAAANTLEETERLIREALQLHVDAMREDDLPIPEPRAPFRYVDVPDA